MLKLDGRLWPAPIARPSASAVRVYLRPILLASTAFLAVWFLVTRFSLSSTGHAHSQFWSAASALHADPYGPDAEQFWSEVASVMAKHRPSFEEVRISGNVGWLAYDPSAQPPERPDVLDVSQRQLDELKSIHKAVVADVMSLADRLPFRKGTRGIVTAANNDALTILATSLRMLRKTGSKLPVEIMIDDWEAEPCETIFPSLGARCIFIEEFMVGDSVPEPFRFGHFGWKAAVVAFSSFEQILFMDADLFPVDKPDGLFKQKPFKNKGYVLWPDYWRSSASRFLFEVLGRPAPSMGERASTESGALMIDKRTHAKAVLQSLFYNIYGAKYFYPLFSQGATGFGDKETWLAAAEVHDLPYYQLSEGPARLGYACNGKDRAIASTQHHPGDDYAMMLAGVRNRAQSMLWQAPAPRPMFVHGNLPKYDGPAIIEWDMPELEWQDMLRCDRNKGQAHRLWGSKEMTIARFGWDAEKALWDSMRWVACEHERGFAMWTNGTWHSKPRETACRDLAGFYEELMPNERYDASMAPVKRTSAREALSQWLE